MIKCFIVECKDSDYYGSRFNFKQGLKYVAKVSNKHTNTISVLDEKNNWVAFDYFPMCMRARIIYTNLFEQKAVFHSPTKQEIGNFAKKCKGDDYRTSIDNLYSEFKKLSAM